MKTPDFMSYTKYNKKKKEPSKNVMIVFVATFFAMILLFTVIAKALSPDVDVVIGDESETDAKESGLGVKNFIDDRLKMIQMEDNSSGTATQTEEKTAKTEGQIVDSQSQEVQPEYEEEAMNLPSSAKTQPKPGATTGATATTPNTAVAPPRPQPKAVSTQPIATTRAAKVYVGRYATLDQAKVAQEIILDSGVDVTPFIKNLGDSYTLQIGSYSTRAKAEGVAIELQQNGFPARIVQE